MGVINAKDRFSDQNIDNKKVVSILLNVRDPILWWGLLQCLITGQKLRINYTITGEIED